MKVVTCFLYCDSVGKWTYVAFVGTVYILYILYAFNNQIYWKKETHKPFLSTHLCNFLFSPQASYVGHCYLIDPPCFFLRPPCFLGLFGCCLPGILLGLLVKWQGSTIQPQATKIQCPRLLLGRQLSQGSI
jgi:hypothetical protein